LSVRATERLIGDLVIVTALSNSPKMIVQGLDVENKLICTAWFTDKQEYQEGFFPANALDRVEAKTAKKKTTNATPAKKGKK